MHIIRPAHPADHDILLKLARTVHFINLPADKDIIAEKIARSRASFRAAAAGSEIICSATDESATSGSPLFMFVIADPKTNTCIGTSMIIAQMGTPDHPNVSFMLNKKEFFSTDLQTGATHTVAKLHLDTEGKTEIGGLILGPSMRKHPERLGSQLSLVRFHYIGRHREQFIDHMLAEMIAPITPDGRNTFWEHLGRRFINLSYVEADKFCQHSREFMTSLLPREEIYLTLLPPEARQGIAQVGKDTVPARRMLERLGFAYTGRIDPFDGGPHLECETDSISLVRHTESKPFVGSESLTEDDQMGLVSTETRGDDFRAVHAQFRSTDAGVILPDEAVNLLQISAGVSVTVTPLDFRKQTASTSPESAPATPPRKHPDHSSAPS